MKDWADLIGRIFIAFMFLNEAFDSLFHKTKNIDTLLAYGIDWRPNLLINVSIVLLVLGGIMVLLGYFSRFGATLLLLYWIPFTIIVYSYWNDPEDLRRFHALMFTRNLAICAGLLFIIANGSGKFSVRRLIHTLRLPK